MKIFKPYQDLEWQEQIHQLTMATYKQFHIYGSKQKEEIQKHNKTLSFKKPNLTPNKHTPTKQRIT